MNIICGHCKGRHASIDDVRVCALEENMPEEVTCGICDALKGYASTEEEAAVLERTGCGCDGMKGIVQPMTIEEWLAEQRSLPVVKAVCNCDPGNGVYCNPHRIEYGLGLTRAYND